MITSRISYRKVRVVLALIICTAWQVATFPPASFSAGPAPPTDKPIDIQANEQEFAGDHVIARGNVRVTYKDSMVVAPMATLYRNPDGSPQKAVFTGHPRLTQGQNRMDADTLIFEISNQRVFADGNSHSEVISNDQGADAETKPVEAPAANAAKAMNQSKSTAAPKGAKRLAAKAPSTPGQPFKWPTTSDPEERADTESSAKAPAQAAAQKSEPEQAADSSKAASEKNTAGAAPSVKATRSQVSQKIITDADKQQFDRASGKFEAQGHVRVRHGDISVHADKLNLVYGTDNKPETAVFSGNVEAAQFDNMTQADTITYFLSTQRLQATGNVRSKVIQHKGDGLKKGGLFSQKSDSAGGDPLMGGEGQAEQPMVIISDAQDFSKETGRLSAEGNVKVKYGETLGVGPKVVVTRNDEGQPDRVSFTGRSQISQPGKQWIGDRITFIINDHKVLAEGNTRAIILQQPKRPGAAPPPQVDNSKMASTPRTPAGGNSALSASRVEKTE